MERLKLVQPKPEHQRIAEEFKKEFFYNREYVINGSALLDQMEYADWLRHLSNNSNPETARKDWVTANTFFAVRDSDGKLIGIIDVRHSIDNEFLTQYGGHIGYAVRPSERQKGYAAEMLNLALEYAKEIGLNKVMLGCYADNLASKKTIIKCGGKLTETKLYTDGKMMEIYWIHLIPDSGIKKIRE